MDLAGFLQGGRHLPWRDVVLAPELNAEEWRTIECFQARAREFLLNVADLRLPKIQHLSLDRDKGPMRVSVAGYPGRHRAKGLFLDFRHLLANDEPGTFRRTRNIVRRRALDEALCKFLDGMRFLSSDDDPAFEFMGAVLTTEELLKLWFNTEFFHSGDSEQLDVRERMLDKLHQSGAGPLLFWTVVRAAHPVKALYACVKDLRRYGPLVVRCPDGRIVGAPESA